MSLRFGCCELDIQTRRLLRDGAEVSLEPLVLDLLIYLIQHRDRVISRDELLDQLWRGKVVGDAALSTCIKAARQALGDDGVRQAWIATLHRRGYRFVGELNAIPEDQVAAVSSVSPADLSAATRFNQLNANARHAAVAVLPFVNLMPQVQQRRWGAALSQEVTSALAQLRSLYVIAQASVSALVAQSLSLEQLAQGLAVDYLVTGQLLPLGKGRGAGLAIWVELQQMPGGRLLWSHQFECPLPQALGLLEDIASKIASSLASEIEWRERNLARLKPQASLDAWELYHRGLWHMYKFTNEDNQQAQVLFAQAIARDPHYANAHAGLSFTYFQSGFQAWGDAREATQLALASAELALLSDERNPSALWAMGRAQWLAGDQPSALHNLQLATDLSPSFAQGHYARAFVLAQAGDAGEALKAADIAQRLSPCDPLLFAIQGARAIALMRLGRSDEAVALAQQASAQPNAHAHIHALASLFLARAGDMPGARAQLAQAQLRQPGYQLTGLLQAFHFEPELKAAMAKTLASLQ